jgi:ferredoxin-type protein NapG
MKIDIKRRKFISKTLQTACAVSVGGLLLGLEANDAKARPALALRPPGALPENDFLAECTRCGLCVTNCPYNILKLAEVGDDVALGTPYFTARNIPCEMCEDIPCVPVCPTKALDHNLTNIDDARMGLAVLIDQETCIAFLGLRCEVCYRVCPVIDKAITLNILHNPRSGLHALFIPVVHSDACTGCGKCEYACILPETAIRVLPKYLAQGAASKSYRFGWEEKEKAGGSLVAPDIEHKYNLPEGVRYEHGTRGLVQDEKDKKEEVPFKANPLDTLNQGFE